jgi:serine phosphatase RsbU (regulator of sigma subunit)/pSer/pThr/pTyr-binding forkhead associated (FHA) protein
MAVLKKVGETPNGQFIELREGPMVIGRSPECDIVLNNQGVSRRHAEVKSRGGNFLLSDLHSRNKTKVNDRDLDPGEDLELRNGDRINICDVEFVFYTKLPVSTEPPRARNEMQVVDTAGEATMHTLDASRSAMQVSAIRPEEKLRAILEIGRNLSSLLEIDTVAPKILDTLFELFNKAERGFLVLKEEPTGKLIRKAFKHRPSRGSRGLSLSTYQDEVPMTLSRTIVNHVLDQKTALVCRDAGNHPDLPTTASIADLKIRSVMCAPLLTPDGKALGILQLDSSDRNQFDQEDLDLLAAVANQAAIAIQNATLHQNLIHKDRIDRDLQQAQKVQKIFLPHSVPRITGYEFFAHYHSAYEVGGDYYDFVPLPGNRLAIALGDVAGKGIAAALMMAKFSGDTRYCILTEDAPAPAADALNCLLCDAGIDEKFITLSLSILDPATGSLTLSSAGHPPVLIRRVEGHIDRIGEETSGFPLGILPDSVYQQEEVTLRPGDIVVVYSDGVTDARNVAGEQYVTTTEDRLIRKLSEAAGGPEAVGKAIIQDIREFSAGAKQFDDITLVCFGPF